MFEPVNIYGIGSFVQRVSNELPNLKAEIKAAFGKHIRRIDRFTQLSLIGASQCLKGIEIHKNTGLYLSSVYGSLNNSLDVLKGMFKDASIPGPLKFVNTVSNAACFHLAEQFCLQANNQFIARDHFALEGCLKFAELDMQLNRTDAALVGVVSEIGMPLKVHRERLSATGAQELCEGSHWLLLAKNMPNQSPLARIILLEEPLSFESLLEKINHITNFGKSVDVIYACHVQESEKEKIGTENILNTKCFLQNNMAYEFTESLNVCEWLTSATTNHRLMHIDTDGYWQWSIIVLEKVFS